MPFTPAAPQRIQWSLLTHPKKSLRSMLSGLMAAQRYSSGYFIRDRLKEVLRFNNAAQFTAELEMGDGKTRSAPMTPALLAVLLVAGHERLSNLKGVDGREGTSQHEGDAVLKTLAAGVADLPPSGKRTPPIEELQVRLAEGSVTGVGLQWLPDGKQAVVVGFRSGEQEAYALGAVDNAPLVELMECLSSRKPDRFSISSPPVPEAVVPLMECCGNGDDGRAEAPETIDLGAHIWKGFP